MWAELYEVNEEQAIVEPAVNPPVGVGDEVRP